MRRTSWHLCKVCNRPTGLLETTTSRQEWIPRKSLALSKRLKYHQRYSLAASMRQRLIREPTRLQVQNVSANLGSLVNCLFLSCSKDCMLVEDTVSMNFSTTNSSKMFQLQSYKYRALFLSLTSLATILGVGRGKANLQLQIKPNPRELLSTLPRILA